MEYNKILKKILQDKITLQELEKEFEKGKINDREFEGLSQYFE